MTLTLQAFIDMNFFRCFCLLEKHVNYQLVLPLESAFPFKFLIPAPDPFFGMRRGMILKICMRIVTVDFEGNGVFNGFILGKMGLTP